MSNKSENIENKLIHIVSTQELSEQSQIQERLVESGISLPQSTLSRWLKKLNIAKVNNRYQIIIQPQLNRILLVSVKAALPNMLLCRTLPGNANSLAIQIDQRLGTNGYDGVLGTIAGDDTVLIIMEDKGSLLRFKRQLEESFEHYFVFTG